MDNSYSCIMAVYNIPNYFDTFSLREYFENLIEKKAFLIFHFKNRPDSILRVIVKKEFPEIDLEDEIEMLPSLSSEKCDSTYAVDFQSLVHPAQEVHCVQKKVSQVGTNAKSAFIKVKSEYYKSFLQEFHKKPWECKTINLSAVSFCYITLLCKEFSKKEMTYEEFFPPHALQHGNVGTTNYGYVKLLRSNILSETMIQKIKVRAPELWSWVNASPIRCFHRKPSFGQCVYMFVYNIPHLYEKKDLQAFFEKDLKMKAVCDIIYLKRPASNLKMFLEENLPQYLFSSVVEETASEFSSSDTTDTDEFELYPFSSQPSDETKSCLIKVKEANCDSFVIRNSNRQWPNAKGKCQIIKIKQVDTSYVQFLSEYRHSRQYLSLPNPPCPRQLYTEVFRAGLVPQAVAQRCSLYLPQLWSKIVAMREQSRTNISRKPDATMDVGSARHTVKRFVEIPPPKSLMASRKYRHFASAREKIHASQDTVLLAGEEVFPNDLETTLIGDNMVQRKNYSDNIMDKETVFLCRDNLLVATEHGISGGCDFRDRTEEDEVSINATANTKNEARPEEHDSGINAEKVDIHRMENVTNSGPSDVRLSSSPCDGGIVNEAVFHSNPKLLASENSGIKAPDEHRKHVNKNCANDSYKQVRNSLSQQSLETGSSQLPFKKRKTNSRKRKRQPHASLADDDSGSEDGNDVEEWERGEAFRPTLDEKQCARERLYEEEIELVWEKGGSGINWHTDEAYWRAQEGGFDERTTDEWDVDMQGYYGGVPGDYDAECRQDMDRMDWLRAGAEESCFRAPSCGSNSSNRQRPRQKQQCATRSTTLPFIAPCSEGPDAARRRMLVNLRKDDEPVPSTKTARRKANKSHRALTPATLGDFERHTRGIGRRLLESKGWQDGLGLGKDNKGRPHIVPDVGRNPIDKKGLGYEDPVPCWQNTSAHPTAITEKVVTTTTIAEERLLLQSRFLDFNMSREDELIERLCSKICSSGICKQSRILTKLIQEMNGILKSKGLDTQEVLHGIRFLDTKRRKLLINELKHLNAIEGEISYSWEAADDKRKSLLDNHLQILREYGSDDETCNIVSEAEVEMGNIQNPTKVCYSQCKGVVTNESDR